jgi:hypothetical protein
MAEKHEHWLDYDHIFDSVSKDGVRTNASSSLPADIAHGCDYDHIFSDIISRTDKTLASIPLPVTISNVEHRQVYRTPQGHEWCSWCYLCKSPKNVLHLTFKTIEGGAEDMKPDYCWQYNSPESIRAAGITRQFRTVESNDDGRTWRQVDVSDDSNTAAMRIWWSVWLDERTLIGSGGERERWDETTRDYERIGRATVARSVDGGTTWTDYVNLNDPSQDLLFHEAHMIRLADGTLVLPAYGQFDRTKRKISDGYDAALYFSTDDGRTWSEPLIVGMAKPTLSFEEPSVVQLGNGDLLVVARHTNREQADNDGVYVNCGQRVIRNIAGQWVTGPHTLTPMGFRGHPVLLRTSRGVVICAGSGNQFNFSIDDGATWSETQRIIDPVYNRHNHYPVLTELADGRVASFYHFGNDWPYPSPEPQWIHSTIFDVKPI